ncbi:uncharacterized protein LOC106466218 [Limulus polyphemus]|uniref:Uncharacterized protein LOC106466218 n=1 Tax=Limulus polyphemus TaxID=6850 RepID=A0ABM1BH67_LIMPO|nr:uncharacterized protein LOC106466218 [Limulus polyphemus]
MSHMPTRPAPQPPVSRITRNGSVPSFKSYDTNNNNNQEHKHQLKSHNKNLTQPHGIQPLSQPTIIRPKGKAGHLKKKPPPRPPLPKSTTSSSTFNTNNLKPVPSQKSGFFSDLETIFGEGKESTKYSTKSHLSNVQNRKVPFHPAKPVIRHSSKRPAPIPLSAKTTTGDVFNSSTSATAPSEPLLIDFDATPSSLTPSSVSFCSSSMSQKSQQFDVIKQKQNKSEENLLSIDDIFSLNDHVQFQESNLHFSGSAKSDNFLTSNNCFGPDKFNYFQNVSDESTKSTGWMVIQDKTSSRHSGSTCTELIQDKPSSRHSRSTCTELVNCFSQSVIPETATSELKVPVCYNSSCQSTWLAHQVTSTYTTTASNILANVNAQEERSLFSNFHSADKPSDIEIPSQKMFSPPEPHFPPPALPHVADLDVEALPIAMAIKDYHPLSHGELNLQIGDLVTLIKEEEDWFYGKCGEDKGKVPKSHVEVINPLPSQESNSVASSNKEKKCLAVYNFEAENSDELSFKEGDIITLCGIINADWWMGSLNNQKGIFPSSFVEMKEDEILNSEETQEKKASTVCMVVALYDFPGEQKDDLVFKEGDRINVIARINKDWLYGECCGQKGYFPAAFVHKPTEETENQATSTWYVAKYPFQGENSDELTFSEGERIILTRIINSNWWQGKLVQDPAGKEGKFPSMFVEKLA